MTFFIYFNSLLSIYAISIFTVLRYLQKDVMIEIIMSF